MDVWDFNLRHLRAVAEIHRRGNTHAAAAAVNLTQPAITQALARIEAKIGLPLFERSHDGMTPTEAADLLVPRIDAALAYVASPYVTMARLRAMLALADAGSYSGASHRSGLSSPSIHRAVGDLALSVRRRLVERRGNVILLTEAGVAIARAFRLARVELQAGLSEIEALKGHETRRIAVGTMPLARARVLPSAITRFLRRHPRVHVAIVEGSRGELVEPLRNGAIDLMIGALRDPLIEPDLVQRPLFVDVPAVIGRAGHPLAGGAPTLAELAAYPWITATPGAPLFDAWQRLFAEVGKALPPAPIESGSVTTIRQILADSDFLTLLSPDQVEVEFAAGWLARIAGVPPHLGRTIGITSRASWRPTIVQAEFAAELAAVAAGD